MMSVILAFSFERFLTVSISFIVVFSVISWIFQTGNGKTSQDRLMSSLMTATKIFIAFLIIGGLSKACDFNKDCEEWCDCHPCK